MSYITNHTGPQIDTSLERGSGLRIVNNGWIRLNSTPDAPVNLNLLVNPGNYTIFYWNNGPTFDLILAPLNVVVLSFDSALYQFAEAGNQKFMRIKGLLDAGYGEWLVDQSEGAVNPGPEAPVDPVEGKTVWIDTTTPNPSIKLYTEEGTYVEVKPTTGMTTDIYDTLNKATDIFKYIDDAIKNASIEGISIDFESHIQNQNIHATELEILKWNNTASQNQYNNAVNQLTSNVQTNVQSTVAGDIEKVNELTIVVNGYTDSLGLHITNVQIHPDATKQAEWDSKAAGDHTHFNDGRVTIPLENLIGTLLIDNVPFDAKERAYIVSSVEEMNALQRNPYHNGDLVCLEPEPGKGTWYAIIDDSKLGTAGVPADTPNGAFKLFSAIINEIDWSLVVNRPTTVEGYGITDTVTTEDIEAAITQIDESIAELPPTVDFSSITETKTRVNDIDTTLTEIDGLLDRVEQTIVRVEEIVV